MTQASISTVNSKAVPLSDYGGHGCLQAEVLPDSHPVFGNYILLRGVGFHNVEVKKIPFQHLVDAIQVAEVSPSAEGSEIPLRDFDGNAWLFLSRDERQIDHQEKKPLIGFRMKDLGLGITLHFRQKLLKDFIGEISSRLPSAEVGSAA